jgi:hypothetical protein
MQSIVEAEKYIGRRRNMMDYQQVRKRVEEEDRVLKKIVIETGIGMFLALLITIFIVR